MSEPSLDMQHCIMNRWPWSTVDYTEKEKVGRSEKYVTQKVLWSYTTVVPLAII